MRTSYIKRGAETLDKLIPGWFRKVKITELDLSCSCGCVIGQLDNAGYYSKLEEKGLLEMPARYGFDIEPYVDDGEREYDKLTEAWKGEIRARRKGKLPS